MQTLNRNEATNSNLNIGPPSPLPAKTLGLDLKFLSRCLGRSGPLRLDQPVTLLDPPAPLQARVNLGERVSRPVRAPGIAQPVELILIGRRQPAAQVGGALEVLHAQSGLHVPGDVAVEEPGARVVRLEGQQQPALGRQHRHVPPHRVGPAEPGQVDDRVEDEALLRGRGHVGGAAEDVEVVALEKGRV